MNSSDELSVAANSRQCTDYSVRSILALTSSSHSTVASVSVSVAGNMEGSAHTHARQRDVIPASSILSELQRTVSDRTSVSLTGRVCAASGADFILAPVVGAGAALRPFDMLDQRGCDDRHGSSLAGDAADSGADSPTVELEYKPLWDQFATFGTEMVITKSGRLVGWSLARQCLSCNLSFAVVLRRVYSERNKLN